MLAAVIATFLTSLVWTLFLMNNWRDAELIYPVGAVVLNFNNIINVIDEKFVAVDPQTSVKEAIEASIEAQSSEGYCIGEEKSFIGKYALTMLLNAPPEAPVKKYLLEDPAFLNHDASLLQAMEVASNFVGETIPVVDRENGQLVGVVSEGYF